MHIDSYLNQLQETWGYTIEELNDIKAKMAYYASDATMSSDVRKEAWKIAEENNKKYEESRKH